MNSEEPKRPASIFRLIEVMKRLRAKDGCPWDLQQTHNSLSPYLIEEAYEVVQAIENKDVEGLKDELGDLLLHIVFHAQIASEQGHFDFEQLAETITDKIIRRHPHVFGNEKAADSNRVKERWEEIKSEFEQRSLLSGVPATLPALLKAFRVQEKTAGVGFDWEDISGVTDKIKEEIEEFSQALKDGQPEKMEAEFGDLLFALVNLGRWLGINAELSLNRAVEKFIHRFEYIEKRLAENGSSPRKSTLKEMDAIWNEAKKEG
jgi:tetrapyrrole methylase family protein/MazG family protein